MVGPAGGQHGGGQIDHRRTGEGHQRLRGGQRRSATIGIADGIEDHLVRRQRHFGIVKLRYDHVGLEHPVVQQLAGGNVPAHRRHQQQ